MRRTVETASWSLSRIACFKASLNCSRSIDETPKNPDSREISARDSLTEGWARSISPF
jgi:hypothetical protein